LVRESIDSALAQSFSDFEIVIVDDGSTDDTELVIKAISSNRVLYYKKQNGERGAARNFGIEKANGKYVVFMDSDDRMMTNHLDVLYEHLTHKEEDFIATKYTIFTEHEKKTPNEVKRLLTGYHNYETFLIGNPLACCFTIRKANSKLIKFREELTFTIMEDWIFLMENLQSSKLYLLDKVTMGLRDHDMRSMRGSALRIVNARKNALGYLIESKNFSRDEQRILTGHSNYFCAVHSYLDGYTKEGFRYLMRSIIEIGFSINAASMLLKLSLQNLWARNLKKGF
jgi:GalNAc5-diNAcBac-PP-undecaprenol beta-1,3-glucosyltransferase